MEKNTGKTETLNYVLSCLSSYNDIRVGVTSIGIDGEKTDQVTKTHKPEINISKKTLFITAEHFYKQKEIVSNIFSISQKGTSLGRLITAEAISEGKVLLAGASNTLWLKETIKELHKFKANLVLVDGALSRKSFGSPSITDAMILSTGAALSINLNTLVQKTAFVYRMTQLEQVEKRLQNKLLSIETGIYAIDSKGRLIDLNIPSILMIEEYKDIIFSHGTRIFVSGIITDKLIDFLKAQKNTQDIEIIIKDFTKIFCKAESLDLYFRKGGKLKVVQSTNLIAITVNPTSPSGYNLNSKTLIDELKKHIPLPIYNIKEI